MKTSRSAAGEGARPSADERTRDRVARRLLERGSATAAVLSADLGLTAAAVRRHLDAMAADGLLADAPTRPLRGRIRGRGRPARSYRLTDAGRREFPHAYDATAAAALRFLAERDGTQAVAAFAQTRVSDLEHDLAAALDGVPVGDRPAALAAALSDKGYAASVQATQHGWQVCQHHCPVEHVAAEFPQFCEAETEVFARVLGSHVQRLATIANGDGVCTTHLPGPAVPAGAAVREAPGTPSALLHMGGTAGNRGPAHERARTDAPSAPATLAANAPTAAQTGAPTAAPQPTVPSGRTRS